MKQLKKTFCVIAAMAVMLTFSSALFASEAESEVESISETEAELLRGAYNYGFVNGTQINGSLVQRGSTLTAITSVSTGNNAIECFSEVYNSSGAYASDSGWHGGQSTANIYNPSSTGGNAWHHARSSNDSTHFATNR